MSGFEIEGGLVVSTFASNERGRALEGERAQFSSQKLVAQLQANELKARAPCNGPLLPADLLELAQAAHRLSLLLRRDGRHTDVVCQGLEALLAAVLAPASDRSGALQLAVAPLGSPSSRGDTAAEARGPEGYVGEPYVRRAEAAAALAEKYRDALDRALARSGRRRARLERIDSDLDRHKDVELLRRHMDAWRIRAATAGATKRRVTATRRCCSTAGAPGSECADVPDVVDRERQRAVFGAWRCWARWQADVRSGRAQTEVLRQYVRMAEEAARRRLQCVEVLERQLAELKSQLGALDAARSPGRRTDFAPVPADELCPSLLRALRGSAARSAHALRAAARVASAADDHRERWGAATVASLLQLVSSNSSPLALTSATSPAEESASYVRLRTMSPLVMLSRWANSCLSLVGSMRRLSVLGESAKLVEELRDLVVYSDMLLGDRSGVAAVRGASAPSRWTYAARAAFLRRCLGSDGRWAVVEALGDRGGQPPSSEEVEAHEAVLGHLLQCWADGCRVRLEGALARQADASDAAAEDLARMEGFAAGRARTEAPEGGLDKLEAAAAGPAAGGSAEWAERAWRRAREERDLIRQLELSQWAGSRPQGGQRRSSLAAPPRTPSRGSATPTPPAEFEPASGVAVGEARLLEVIRAACRREKLGPAAAQAAAVSIAATLRRYAPELNRVFDYYATASYTAAGRGDGTTINRTEFEAFVRDAGMVVNAAGEPESSDAAAVTQVVFALSSRDRGLSRAQFAEAIVRVAARAGHQPGSPPSSAAGARAGGAGEASAVHVGVAERVAALLEDRVLRAAYRLEGSELRGLARSPTVRACFQRLLDPLRRLFNYFAEIPSREGRPSDGRLSASGLLLALRRSGARCPGLTEGQVATVLCRLRAVSGPPFGPSSGSPDRQPPSGASFALFLLAVVYFSQTHDDGNSKSHQPNSKADGGESDEIGEARGAPRHDQQRASPAEKVVAFAELLALHGRNCQA